MIRAEGNSTRIPIVGPNAQLSVVEIKTGASPSLSLDLDGLQPGETYVARVSAQNTAGYGPTTTAAAADGGDRGSNNDGLGIVPFGVVARAAPQAPKIASVTALSASQLEVVLENATEAPGYEAVGYKVRNCAFREFRGEFCETQTLVRQLVNICCSPTLPNCPKRFFSRCHASTRQDGEKSPLFS